MRQPRDALQEVELGAVGRVLFTLLFAFLALLLALASMALAKTLIALVAPSPERTTLSPFANAIALGVVASLFVLFANAAFAMAAHRRKLVPWQLCYAMVGLLTLLAAAPVVQGLALGDFSVAAPGLKALAFCGALAFATRGLRARQSPDSSAAPPS